MGRQYIAPKRRVEFVDRLLSFIHDCRPGYSEHTILQLLLKKHGDGVRIWDANNEVVRIEKDGDLQLVTTNTDAGPLVVDRFIGLDPNPTLDAILTALMKRWDEARPPGTPPQVADLLEAIHKAVKRY